MDRTRPSPTTPRTSKRVRPAGTTPNHLRRYDVDTFTGEQSGDDDDYDYLPPLPPPLEIPEDFYASLHNNDNERGSRRKSLWFTPRGSSPSLVTLPHDADEAEAEASDSVKVPDNAGNRNNVFIVDSSDDEICAENLTSEFGEFSLHEDRKLRSPFDSDDTETTAFGVVPELFRQGTSHTMTAKRKDKIQQSLLPAKAPSQPTSIVADGDSMVQVGHDFDDDDESMSGSDFGGAMLGYSPSTDLVVILSDNEDGINPSCAHEPHKNFLHVSKGQSDADEPMYDLEDDYQDRGLLTHSPSFEPPISLLSHAKSSSRESSSTQSRPPLKGRLEDRNTAAAGSKTRKNKGQIIPKKQVPRLNHAKKSKPAPKVPIMPDYSAMTLPELKTIANKYGFRATSRNIMVGQLERVWNTLHPASQPVALQPPVAVTSKDTGGVESKLATTTREEGQVKKNRDRCKIVTGVEMRSEIIGYQEDVRDSSSDSDSVSKNSGVNGEDEDSLDEDEDKDEDEDEDENEDKDDDGENLGNNGVLDWGHLMPLEDDGSSAAVAPSVNSERSIEERLSEFIKGDQEWYGRVLRYEPLNVDKLYYDLVAKCRYFCTKPRLLKFLDSQGIVFEGSGGWREPKARGKE